MPSSESDRYKIGTLGRLTGLTPEVLRAWQRRFALFEPERTEGRQRLYTPDDLRLALHLRNLTESGQSIGAIALRGRAALVAEARRQRPDVSDVGLERPVAQPLPTLGDLGALRDAVVRGAQAIDPQELAAALDQAVALASVRQLVQQVVVPASRRIGGLWAAGECSVAGEHLASSMIRERLLVLMREAAPPAGRAAPEALVACAPDDFHENGALAVAILLAARGWRITLLGAATPIADLDMACRTRRPHAVYVSSTQPSSFTAAREALLTFVRRWAGAFEIVIGGQGAPDEDAGLTEAGARVSPAWTPPSPPVG